MTVIVCALSFLTTACGKKTEEEAPVAAGSASASSNPTEALPENIPAVPDVLVVATAPTPDVVYNVTIEPQLAPPTETPKVVVLREGTPTTVRFSLGPRSAQSILNVKPNPAITSGATDKRLTVLLVCSLCENESPLRHITYHVQSKHSDVATFVIAPRTETDGRQSGRLEFSVYDDSTLQEYDHFTVSILSLSDKGDRAANNAPPTVFAHEPVPDPTGTEPDVMLFITSEADQRIAVEVQPSLHALVQSLGTLPFTADGTRRKFVSSSLRELERNTVPGYARVSQITLQDAEIAKVLKSPIAGGGSISGTPALDLKFSKTDAQSVMNVFGELGKSLHRILFSEGDPSGTLGAIIGKLEGFAVPGGRPLRLAIVTTATSLPWQYLHPVGTGIQASEFWGLKFSLTVIRRDNDAAGPLRPAGSAKEVVFAEYGETADESIKFATEEIDALNKLTQLHVTVVNSGKKLLDLGIKPNRARMAALMTFLHAASGQTLEAATGTVVSASEIAGPIMRFNTADSVAGFDIEALKNDLTESEQRTAYLSSSPIVILNACETGPSTIAVNQVSLPDAFFKLGAQGVVVTETRVWDTLAHAVGMRLITKLGNGETVSDALVQIRRELYAEGSNPLGLLYAYYGNPTATLLR